MPGYSWNQFVKQIEHLTLPYPVYTATGLDTLKTEYLQALGKKKQLIHLEPKLLLNQGWPPFPSGLWTPSPAKHLVTHQPTSSFLKVLFDINRNQVETLLAFAFSRMFCQTRFSYRWQRQSLWCLFTSCLTALPVKDQHLSVFLSGQAKTKLKEPKTNQFWQSWVEYFIPFSLQIKGEEMLIVHDVISLGGRWGGSLRNLLHQVTCWSYLNWQRI